MPGEFLFVFSKLLFNFLESGIKRRYHGGQLCGSHEVLGVFGGCIDFNMRLILMLEIDNDADGIHSIEKATNFLRLLANNFLIVTAQ